ncbi:MAG: MBL fold metallo-hydrolase [Anaerolineae bacterium]|nr:MBL fold metallo-hydrolase [Anaerolineae bacterium]
MREIVPDVWMFSGLMMGRVYAIKDSDGLTIIDAGLGLAAERILSQIAAAGYQPSDVKRILITHAHPDHVGGLPALQARTGAALIASSIEAPVLEGRAPQQVVPLAELSLLNRLMRGGRETGETLPGTPVSRTLEDGERLPDVMGGLQAILTPGHTPGHTAFWQPERRVLFCGDALMHFFRLSEPFHAFSSDLAAIKRSIRKVADLAPEVVCFGHGAPLLRDAPQTLRQFAVRLRAT